MNLSTGRRVVLTIIVVLVALLLIAAIGYLGGHWEALP